jgi:hypothetical protein
MQHVERTLYSSARACRYGCQYCFARFPRFEEHHLLPMVSVDRAPEDSVIYPACDSEFFTDARAVSELEKLVRFTGKSVRISISIKSRIGAKQAQFLRELNDRLTSADRGLIKCSISLSTKHQIENCEPRTPGYSDRLRGLRILADEGVPTSVNLKPILPFVTVTEYSEIIADTAPYTGAYLVGGLYIDTTTEFGRQIKLCYSSFITTRRVDWLPNRPTWEYCENPLQLESIRQSIIASGRRVFDTDLLVEDYLRSRSLNLPARS